MVTEPTVPPPELARFFDGQGGLLHMPRRTAVRHELLTWLSSHLPANRDLTEQEVNEALSSFGDDVAMMRRYLVDHRLVQRRPPGIYYRWFVPGS